MKLKSLLILFLVSWVCAAEVKQTHPASAIDLPVLYQGSQFESDQSQLKSIQDFKGVVVVDFWASWCIPCRKSLPVMMDLKKQYPKVTFITINIDSKLDRANKFYNLLKLDFPTLHDVDKKVSESLNVGGMPSLYIFDSEKKLVYSKEGYIDSDLAQVKEELAKW